jgi:hypothetical protein
MVNSFVLGVETGMGSGTFFRQPGEQKGSVIKVTEKLRKNTLMQLQVSLPAMWS